MLTKEEIEARRLMALAKEIEANQRSLWWLSFCDTDKPTGQEFLGVIVVEELGPMHAVNKTHELGINPGGQVMVVPVAADSIKPEHLNRLMLLPELQEMGYVEMQENGDIARIEVQ